MSILSQMLVVTSVLDAVCFHYVYVYTNFDTIYASVNGGACIVHVIYKGVPLFTLAQWHIIMT